MKERLRLTQADLDWVFGRQGDPVPDEMMHRSYRALRDIATTRPFANRWVALRDGAVLADAGTLHDLLAEFRRGSLPTDGLSFDFIENSGEASHVAMARAHKAQRPGV